MPKDHFIAQTYLKRFGDPNKNGMLHAYKKKDGTAFQCWPKDVCHEWDGDKNYFIKDTKLLGDFRKIFEPHWNSSIIDILSNDISNENKFVISGYLANLMITTPAWIRVIKNIYEKEQLSRLKFKIKMQEKHGNIDSRLKEEIEMLEKGELTLSVDERYMKDKATKFLLYTAIQTYNQNWEILLNKTNYPFITSDNPVAIDYSGRLKEPVVHFLPITPTICLRIENHPIGHIELNNIARYITLPPLGRITKTECSNQEIKHINRLITKCAETLIFSSQKDSKLQALAIKYGKYRVDSDYIEIPGEEDSIYQGVILRVREI